MRGGITSVCGGDRGVGKKSDLSTGEDPSEDGEEEDVDTADAGEDVSPAELAGAELVEAGRVAADLADLDGVPAHGEDEAARRDAGEGEELQPGAEAVDGAGREEEEEQHAGDGDQHEEGGEADEDGGGGEVGRDDGVEAVEAALAGESVAGEAGLHGAVLAHADLVETQTAFPRSAGCGGSDPVRLSEDQNHEDREADREQTPEYAHRFRVPHIAQMSIV